MPFPRFSRLVAHAVLLVAALLAAPPVATADSIAPPMPRPLPTPVPQNVVPITHVINGTDAHPERTFVLATKVSVNGQYRTSIQAVPRERSEFSLPDMQLSGRSAVTRLYGLTETEAAQLADLMLALEQFADDRGALSDQPASEKAAWVGGLTVENMTAEPVYRFFSRSKANSSLLAQSRRVQGSQADRVVCYRQEWRVSSIDADRARILMELESTARLDAEGDEIALRSLPGEPERPWRAAVAVSVMAAAMLGVAGFLIRRRNPMQATA